MEIEESLIRIDNVVKHFIKIHSVDVQNDFEENENLNLREGKWKSELDGKGSSGEGEYKGGEIPGEECFLQVFYSINISSIKRYFLFI